MQMCRSWAQECPYSAQDLCRPRLECPACLFSPASNPYYAPAGSGFVTFGRKVPIGCEEANLAFVQAESSRDHRSMEGEFCYTQHFVHIVCFLFCFHNRSAFCIANNLCSLTHHHVDMKFVQVHNIRAPTVHVNVRQDTR
ncbi:hypothetical protein E4T42_05682 [Aureobasidium subglaciale]|nr:hypothetical protein E4T42_05682 [Aureobasidium subglaciale]